MKKPVFIGQITIQHRYGYPYIDFEKKADHSTLCWLVRRIYGIKSRKKRIVKKYVKRFLSQTLSSYIMEQHRES